MVTPLFHSLYNCSKLTPFILESCIHYIPNYLCPGDINERQLVTSTIITLSSFGGCIHLIVGTAKALQT